jgi:glycosyltransferase involved in cell wall biosynthesis
MISAENQDIMKEGLVSIITPIYNGEKYIAETIESVLNQTYTNWEMLITDDGSTDKSADIIREYQRKDARILFFQQKNAGSASARNNGIHYAKGQYITLLDADDVFEPNCLKHQIAFIKEKNAVLAFASCRRINEQSEEFLRPDIARPIVTYKQMLKCDHVHTLTCIYDRTKYGKVFLHEELKSLRDDYAFWLDISKLSGVVYGNREILARFRIIKSSITGKKFKLIKIHFNFFNKYLKYSFLRSFIYTCYWGILGIIKFIR